MNKVIIKFLLARGKFLPKLHLRQPWFSYSTCGPFAKHHAGFKNGLLSMVYKLLQKNRIISNNDKQRECN